MIKTKKVHSKKKWYENQNTLGAGENIISLFVRILYCILFEQPSYYRGPSDHDFGIV